MIIKGTGSVEYQAMEVSGVDMKLTAPVLAMNRGLRTRDCSRRPETPASSPANDVETMSASPDVGLVTTPTTPFPTPLRAPRNPPDLAPLIG